MNTVVLAPVLAVAAVWLLVPSPSAQVRRLATAHLVRAVPGRPGAPPLRQRLWWAVGCGSVVTLLAPPGWGWAAGLGVAVAVAIVTRWWWPGRGRPSGDIAREQPHVLHLLAVCLEAGAPMVRALHVVADVVPATSAALLGEVASQLRLGRTESDAWLELAEHPQWRPVARDVARSARSGTALVELLRVHAEDARRELGVRATREARAVGVRSVVPLMVCFLPTFVLVGVVPIIAGLLRSFLG